MSADANAKNSRELSIRRVLAAPRAAVWRCWTEPALLKQWYCPRPWFVSEARLDLRPGGVFSVVMNGPDGERSDNPGQVLEVVPGVRLVFSDAFDGDWHPAGKPFMVGFVELRDAPGGRTEMVWGARHWTEEDVRQHEAMGFEQGWNACADQLDQLAKSIA
jgi:uncharacterized protein YndB with AHSA1/START domain